jgi:hypothetical protein
MDGKFPVDAAGVVTGLDEKDQPFKDGIELTGLLARSDQVRACVAKQWFRYGMARNEAATDEHSLSKALATFRGSNWDVRELIVTLASSRALTHRTVTAEEELTP